MGTARHGFGRLSGLGLAIGALSVIASGCGDIQVASGAVDLSCATYCELAVDECGGSGTDTSVYANRAACDTFCGNAGITLGEQADSSGNSIGCRSNALLRVKNGSNAATLCPAASPSGGDVCGDWCTVYCDLMANTCPGTFSDLEACSIACEAYPDTGEPGDLSGDTVQCRLYHGFIATDGSAATADTHCPHAGPDGAGVCVN